jgi:hypothetical protein
MFHESKYSSAWQSLAEATMWATPETLLTQASITFEEGLGRAFAC